MNSEADFVSLESAHLWSWRYADRQTENTHTLIAIPRTPASGEVPNTDDEFTTKRERERERVY